MTAELVMIRDPETLRICPAVCDGVNVLWCGISYSTLGAAAESLPQERWELLSDWFIRQSGKREHSSDCATSVAPAYRPGPCDCDHTEAK